jgi:phage gp45-like
MFRQSPLTAAFVGYSGGGARSLVDTIDDETGMQEMKGSFMKGEARSRVESPQNYGFTSVVLPAKKGKDGQIEECAEAYINFLGGNRSFPVAAVMDDRRHRPWALKPGENAQYDDAGQMTLMRRNGLFLLSLDDEEGSGNGGASARAADGGQQQENKERMVSLRHVNKKKQERPKGKSQDQQGGESGGGGGASAGTLAAEGGGGDQSNGKDHKHEGESVNTEVRATKNKIEIFDKDQVVAVYNREDGKWTFTSKNITLQAENDILIKGKTVTVEGSTRVETVGQTYLGLDSKGGSGPRVATEGGHASKTYAKV